jgi:hypothetical protein
MSVQNQISFVRYNRKEAIYFDHQLIICLLLRLVFTCILYMYTVHDPPQGADPPPVLYACIL